MPRVGSWETERTTWSQGSQESPKKKALQKLIKQEFDSTHFITTETISPRVSKTVSVFKYSVPFADCILWIVWGNRDGLMGTVNEYSGVR